MGPKITEQLRNAAVVAFCDIEEKLHKKSWSPKEATGLAQGYDQLTRFIGS